MAKLRFTFAAAAAFWLAACQAPTLTEGQFGDGAAAEAGAETSDAGSTPDNIVEKSDSTVGVDALAETGVADTDAMDAADVAELDASQDAETIADTVDAIDTAVQDTDADDALQDAIDKDAPTDDFGPGCANGLTCSGGVGNCPKLELCCKTWYFGNGCLCQADGKMLCKWTGVGSEVCDICNFPSDVPDVAEISPDIGDIAGEIADTVDSVDVPDIADVAQIPDVAVVPDAADQPDVPQTPDVAHVVDAVDVPDIADVQDISDAADQVDTPDTPDTPDAAAADIDAGCDPAKCPTAPCQQAYCNGEACALKPKAGPCEDGNPCTLDDSCANGACKGGSDSCSEERLDINVVGGLSLSLGNLGFGRYVSQWTSAVGNSLRFSDSDGSRENEEQSVIAANAKGGWNATRTMAGDGIGNTIAMAWGVGSASCAAGNGSPCTDKLGPISATRYGPDGLFAMKNVLQNVQVSFTSPNMQAAMVTASATNAAFIPVAFGDGSVGLLMQYVGTYAPTQNNTGTYSPAQQQLFYTLATSPLVPGVAAAVTGVPVDTAFLRDAVAVPDGTNRFVLVWVEQAQKVLQSRVFAKNGQPVTGIITLQAAGAGIGLPKVVAFDDGSYVTTWHMDAGDNVGQGILARKIKGDFTPLGPAFIVDQITVGDQKNPDIAAWPNGGFAIAWTGPDTAGNGVWLRKFTADTLPVGPDIAVNAVASGEQTGAAVTGMDDGGIVAAFHDAAGGVWTRRFGPDGKPAPGAPERGLALDGTGAQTAPKLATSGDNLMAVWQGLDLRGRVLSANGAEVKAEFDVSTGGAKSAGTVASGAGKFVVGWIANGAAPALNLRWFDAAGNAQSGVLIQDGGSAADATPAIAVAPDGHALALVTAGANALTTDIGYAVFDDKGALGKTAFTKPKGGTSTSHPVVARTADGYVLGMQAKGVDEGGYGVYIQTLSDAGVLGLMVQAHITTGGDQRNLALAVQNNSVIACWEAWAIDVPNSFGIACRYFTAKDLVPTSGEIVPHLPSALDQLQPAVAFVAPGTAAVAWSTAGLDGNGLGLQAAYLDLAGKSLAPRIAVNRTRLGDQTLPQIAALPNGQVAFAWQSVNQQSPTDAGGVHWRVVHAP